MIFDIEADGLLNEATKIHVLAYEEDGKVKSTHNYQEMRDILSSAKELIGHNIICYDIPVLERILKIKIKARLIDTLAMSWYLNHTRNIHGLEAYGEEFGVPKPVINDWVNLSPEEYANRCREDVKINRKLYDQLINKLELLYNSKSQQTRIIDYLSFKMDCVREQLQSKWKVDVDKVKKTLDILLPLQEEKISELKSVMPKVKKYTKASRPAKPFKKDGTYSVHGAKWFNLLKKENLPEDYDDTIQVFSHEEESNPNSSDQVKSWLFSLGWEPANFKYEKNEDGSDRLIPQVRIDGGEGKELCPSVKLLIEENPSVEVLDGLTILQHRISILNGFIENEKEGFLVADVGGLTNTLRFKHRILVNLPGVNKPYGKEIRGSLVAKDGYILCGSDMSSLEENTKKHYMYDYDPDFVIEMSKPGFDAHLDLAKYAKVVQDDDIEFYGWFKKESKNDPNLEGKDRYLKIDNLRKQYKTANYACIYGVGGPKLSRTTGLKLSTALALIEAYWARNWAVKALSEDIEIKTIGKEMWLFNPVSKFWYSLRYKKDIFSTLNQSTGVYCFDSWIREIRKVRPQLTGQFHDEIIIEIKEGFEEKCKHLLKDSIKKVNDKLKLNIILDVDIQFGKTYADIH
ncbi:hypothetical protein KC678_00205 [Candidatus Dojkabacteria bacterium]|uniref:DNA-directed DNA polymerase family A palm domain-containing protein n=1 Tax=Candidatus Dojkabacteria bacterium TaxID=2099670 RepID=A0A955L1F8_9BACT|nr:hypothetical protein [Candidatus Dojkabacteria bacterium]